MSICFRFWAQVLNITENSKPFWRYSKYLLWWLGWDKGTFKVIYFSNINILFTLLPKLWYHAMKVLRIRKVSKFKIRGMFLRTAPNSSF